MSHYTWLLLVLGINCSLGFQPFQRSRGYQSQKYLAENSLIGLSEDGDFAMVGINVDDSETLKSKNNPSEGTEASSLMSGLSFLGIRNIESIAETSPDIETAAMTEATAIQFKGDDKEEQTLLEMWLLDVIPTLSPMYVQRYAKNLVKIGFDPDCDTRYELRFEDLSFMKLLHQRYFYHEIIGTTNN